MEGVDGALDLTATDPHTAIVVLKSIHNRADTNILYARFKIACLDTGLYHVIHQSNVRLLLFVVSRWETAKDGRLQVVNNIIFRLFFFLFFTSDELHFLPLFVPLRGKATTCFVHCFHVYQ